ncbi:MAG: GNAT family N-acetyltransferase [bacterium]|nr:GNAT family N-acetyltransferase [bacterium]
MEKAQPPEDYRNSPAECDAWDNVVVSTYGLVRRDFQDDATAIKFFSKDYREGKSGGTFSTAPYLTDGGVRGGGAITRESVDRLAAFRRSLGADCLLVRTRHDYFRDFADAVHIDRSYLTFMLDLSGGADRIWQKEMNTKSRNQTRKGLKCNPQVRFGHRELLDDFYQVVSRAWRDLGTPTHSKAFYANILRYFGDNATIIAIHLDGAPVSAAMLLTCSQTLHHPYACTIKKYNSLCINNVLYWKIIEWGCARGLAWFDMGRSMIGQGTAAYKKSWGGQPVPVHYNYFLAPGRRPPDYNSRLIHLATAAWKCLPVPVANLLGPRLISGVL